MTTTMALGVAEAALATGLTAAPGTVAAEAAGGPGLSLLAAALTAATAAVDAAGPDLASWWLDAALKSTAALVLTMGLAACLGRASAGVRHLVRAVGLMAALALPLASPLVPWSWPVLPVPAATAVVEGTTGRPARAAELSPAGELALQGPGSGAGSEAVLPATPAAAPGTVSGALLPGDGPSLAGWPQLLVVVWVAGVALVLLHLTWGVAVLARLARRAHAPEGDRWSRALRAAARALDVAPPVVKETPEVTLPMTIGVVRPTVLLPAGAGGWPTGRLRCVLLHELAHVRRRDLLLQVLARVACALHWWNPLAWRAARDLGREGERACDDHVLAAGARPSSYAGHLLEIARSSGRGPALPAMAMARPSELEGRLLAVLDPALRRRLLDGRAAALAVGALVVGVVTLAGLAGQPAAALADASPAGPDAADLVAGLVPSGAPASGVAGPDGAPDPMVAGAESPDLIGALTELLGDGHPHVRAAAARALGERRAAEALPALLAALGDPDEDVRMRVVYALGSLEDPAAIDALALRLREDPEEEVREAAAWALGETETVEAAHALAAALRETGDADLEEHLVRALGETRSSEAVPALEAVLSERPEPGLRTRRGRRNAEEEAGELWRHALAALVEIGSPEALQVVVRAMGDEDPLLRRLAAGALGRSR